MSSLLIAPWDGCWCAIYTRGNRAFCSLSGSHSCRAMEIGHEPGVLCFSEIMALLLPCLCTLRAQLLSVSGSPSPASHCCWVQELLLPDGNQRAPRGAQGAGSQGDLTPSWMEHWVLYPTNPSAVDNWWLHNLSPSSLAAAGSWVLFDRRKLPILCLLL